MCIFIIDVMVITPLHYLRGGAGRGGAGGGGGGGGGGVIRSLMIVEVNYLFLADGCQSGYS